MIKFLKAFSLCLLLAGTLPANGAETLSPEKKKCKATDLKGTWYGNYQLVGSGHFYAMVMEVIATDACQVKGTLHWPDYFNSKVSFEGEIKDGSLFLKEKVLLQGYEMAFDGNYIIKLPDGDTLEGSGFDQDSELVAKIQLLNSKKIPSAEQNKWKNNLAQWASRNGTATIGQEVSEHSSILEKYREMQKAQKAPQAPLEIKGQCTISQLELPLYAVFDFPHNMYLEMEFQNIKLRLGKNASQEWEYNPMEDKLTVKERSSGNEDNDFNFSKDPLLKYLDQGYRVSRINHAQLDSLTTYRLLLEKDESKMAFFLSNQSYQVLRIDEDNMVKLLLNYRQMDGFSMPTLYYQISGKDANMFHFNEISTNPNIQPTLFAVPEELKDKQRATPLAESEPFNISGIENFEQGEYEKAIKAYDKAINLAPNVVNYYLNRGKAKKENEDYYGAINDFDQALRLDPSNAEAFNWKGVAKYMIGDQASALKDFAKSIELDATYQMGYYNMGYTYMEMQEYDKAYDHFSALIKLDTLNQEHLLLGGVCLLNMEDYEQALSLISSAIAAGDESADTYNYRGVAYYSLQQFDKALEDFRMAISIDDTDPVKLQNLGNTYFELDQYKEAVSLYEKALPLAEEKDEIYNRLGLCFYQESVFAQALDYFSKAIEINPRNAVYYDHRALAKNGLMDYAGAIQDYSTSITLYPDDPDVYFQRGLLNVRTHNKYDGCKDLQKASILGHKEAAEMLQKHCSVEISNTDE